MRIGFTGASGSPLPQSGLSDSKGDFSGEGFSDQLLPSGARKDGYYRSSSLGTTFTGSADGKLLPWNQTVELVMRPIGKPVALFARTGWFEIPATTAEVGFDLEAADWVAPYGKGNVADFIFLLSRRYASRTDVDVQADLRFRNPSDGIREVTLPDLGRQSHLQWEREAPADGYISSFSTSLKSNPKTGFQSTATEQQAFFFRVRSKVVNGKLVSALYGKISGGFQITPDGPNTTSIKMTYYLNPNSLDRNLEWDVSRNLFLDLKSLDAPRLP